MKKYGGPSYTCEEIREKVGNGIYVLIEKSLPQGRSNPNYDACMKEFQIYYKAHMLDNTKPYEGIMDALYSLKEHGYHLAIVSNKFDAAVKNYGRTFLMMLFRLRSENLRPSIKNRHRILFFRQCVNWM